MRKSKLKLLNELKMRLLEFPSIVDSLDKKDPAFIEKLLLWFKQCEASFTTHNISEVSELSGLRSKIIGCKFAAEKGLSVRKLQQRAASEVLYEVQQTVLNVVKPLELKVQESRGLIAQLLLIVADTGAVQYNEADPFEMFINGLWQFMSANEQLKPGVIQLKTNLPPGDIQQLLAEELNLTDF